MSRIFILHAIVISLLVAFQSPAQNIISTLAGNGVQCYSGKKKYFIPIIVMPIQILIFQTNLQGYILFM